MSNRVEFVDLARQYERLKPEVDAAILRAVGRGDFILGEDLHAFEAEFASYLGVPHCIGVGDGTDALSLALKALDVGAGDEVIVPANTFIATALAASNVGARPVLVDCEPHFYNMDVAKVEAAITVRTKAIIPVHLYGQSADMDAILHLARRRGIPVVEDAAQAHGATYRGRRCGSMGDVGCFSFYPSKNLGAYGDGGAIVTHDRALAEKIRHLRNWGQKSKYVHTEKGCNSRLDTVQAAVLRVKLRHLDTWNERRRLAAARYGELLADTELSLPEVAPWGEPVWHLYVVRAPNRARLQLALDQANIGHGIHYPVPIHLQQAYSDLGYVRGDFPVAEALAERIVSLPMFPEISDEELKRVAQACRAAVDPGAPGIAGSIRWNGNGDVSFPAKTQAELRRERTPSDSSG
jgi:dTDP-4-amino-4,6-dideoxygalactose transaminase